VAVDVGDEGEGQPLHRSAGDHCQLREAVAAAPHLWSRVVKLGLNLEDAGVGVVDDGRASGRGRAPAHLKQLQRKRSNSIGSGGRSGGVEQRRQTHRASLYGAEGKDTGASSGDLVGDEAGEVTTAPPWMRG
jgi:hypothetical protein